MKILVVSRLKSTGSISVITHRQMHSVQQLGHEVSYFEVAKGGIFGYFQALFKLRQVLRNEKYTIVHAHYSLCGVIASLAGSKVLVVSLMGSDIKKSIFNRLIIKLFMQNKWSKLIVKSQEMCIQITPYLSKKSTVEVIPNGVDFELFKPMDKNVAREYLDWDVTKKIILFASDPNRLEKRYQLAEKAVEMLKNQRINLELIALKDIEPERVPYYLSGCDVLLLTSEREGSPNIIKEAMACNCPIVSTNVGDVETVIGKTEGCIVVSSSKPEIISAALKELLSSGVHRTDGRTRIEWLAHNKIAEKLIDFYEK